MKLTRYIFRWHHWCGLIVGLLLLMMSITGSILTFSDEIEKLDKSISTATNISRGTPEIDASFHNVRKKYPGWEIRLYHLPEQNKPIVYDLRQKEKRRKILADAVTGVIVGDDENANRTLQRQLLLLHYTLFAGTTGKIIVFFTGVFFLITLATGLIVYRKSIIKVFTCKIHFNSRTPRAFYSSLHRIVGVWSVIFNLLIVATGLWLSGHIALTALKTPSENSLKKDGTELQIQSIDKIIQRLSSEYPTFEVHLVRVRATSNVVQVSGRFMDDPSFYGNYYSGFSIDGKSLQILSQSFMKDLPVANRLSNMAAPLHFGNYGGLPLKVIYCILGLTPALLSISGFVLWKKRRHKISPQSFEK